MAPRPSYDRCSAAKAHAHVMFKGLHTGNETPENLSCYACERERERDGREREREREREKERDGNRQLCAIPAEANLRSKPQRLEATEFIQNVLFFDLRRRIYVTIRLGSGHAKLR